MASPVWCSDPSGEAKHEFSYRNISSRLCQCLPTLIDQTVPRTSASPGFLLWDCLKSKVCATCTRELTVNCSKLWRLIAASDADSD